MHIGLIGGIGPAATVAYYEGLVRAFAEANVPLELTISHADVTALISNATEGREAEQSELFARHLRQLQGAGCDIAAITSLTGHFCFDATQRISPLPLLGATAPIDAFCKSHGIRKIGLLGSPSVMQSHLYGQLKDTATVVPETGLEEVGATYLAIATSGQCTETQRHVFFDAGARMIGDQKADAILLAGTDLGLAFAGHDPGYRVIDGLAVHVDALLERAVRGLTRE